MAGKVFPVLTLLISIYLAQFTVAVNFGEGDEFDQQYTEKLLKLMSLQKSQNDKVQLTDGFTASKFEWSSCNKSAPLVLNKLDIAPDPIKIPGNLTIQFDADANVEVGKHGKVVAKVVLKKKFLGKFIEIPCEDNVGSCTYDDVCTMIGPVKPEDCPFKTKTCSCPFKKGNYNLPKTSVEIPSLPIPPSLADGEYQATVKVYDAKGDNLACYEVELTLSS